MTESPETNSQSNSPMAARGIVSDAIVTFDLEGLIVSANSATGHLFGHEPNELIGKNIEELVPKGVSRLRGGETSPSLNINEEIVGQHKSGRSFSAQMTVSQFELNGSRLFTAVIRNISDSHERQARLEAIMGNAVDAIITIDRKGKIESANPATEKLFGYSCDQLVGENVKILMPNPYRDEHDGYMKNYLDTGIKKIIGIGREVIGQRKDGSTFPMHLAVSEIKLGDRHLFTGIVRDISDLKAVERKLENLNEELEDRVKQRTQELRAAQADLVRSEKFATLGKVSGGIAHEIRNPLNAVKTSAYFLLNAKNPSDDKTREHLERIDRQVSLIDNVVTALSDVAKLPDAKLVTTELHPLLKAALAAVSFPPSIVTTIDLPENLSSVLVDENQILIAFKNLIRNARDAMPDGGELKLSVTETSDRIAIHVEDNGIGISEEDLSQILEPLFTTKARGMGLGLSITKAIVEKNQGSLSVESEFGKGSRFTIELHRA